MISQKPIAFPRILLVDDNADTAHIVSVFLEAFSCDCEVAENGIQACDILQKQPFDLVLMDLQMPEMDGIATTKYIRQNLDMKSLPVIGLSAHGLRQEKELCLAAGMDDYIVKPFSSTDLYEAIHKYL